MKKNASEYIKYPLILFAVIVAGVYIYNAFKASEPVVLDQENIDKYKSTINNRNANLEAVCKVVNEYDFGVKPFGPEDLAKVKLERDTAVDVMRSWEEKFMGFPLIHYSRLKNFGAKSFSNLDQQQEWKWLYEKNGMPSNTDISPEDSIDPETLMARGIGAKNFYRSRLMAILVETDSIPFKMPVTVEDEGYKGGLYAGTVLIIDFTSQKVLLEMPILVTSSEEVEYDEESGAFNTTFAEAVEDDFQSNFDEALDKAFDNDLLVDVVVADYGPVF